MIQIFTEKKHQHTKKEPNTKKTHHSANMSPQRAGRVRGVSLRAGEGGVPSSSDGKTAKQKIGKIINGPTIAYQQGKEGWMHPPNPRLQEPTVREGERR